MPGGVANPKRDEMERLMKEGMSRDEAYRTVFGHEPPDTATNKPEQHKQAATENRTEDEIDLDEDEIGKQGEVEVEETDEVVE